MAAPCGPGVCEEVSRSSLTTGRGLPYGPSCHVLNQCHICTEARPVTGWAQPVTECGRDTSLVHSLGTQDSMGDPGGGASLRALPSLP